METTVTKAETSVGVTNTIESQEPVGANTVGTAADRNAVGVAVGTVALKPPTPTSKEHHLLDPLLESNGYRAVWEGLTPEEQASIPDVNMPLRYFRAAKGKTEDAIKKLKATLAWRKEFEVDKIIHAFDQGGDPEMRAILTEENATGKIYVRAHDKEGRAAMYMRPQLENTHNALNNMRHLVYNLERTIRCTENKSDGLEKINLMIDFEGFRLRDSAPLSTTKWTISILESHYPERLYRAYVLHAGFIFRTFMAVVRPFLDPVTKEKVCLCHGLTQTKSNVGERFDLAHVEPCAGGEPGTVPDFDSNVYMIELPFHQAFPGQC